MVSGLVNALRASVMEWTFSGCMSRWTRKQGSSVALGGAPCARTSLRSAPPNTSLAGVTPPCTTSPLPLRHTLQYHYVTHYPSTLRRARSSLHRKLGSSMTMPMLLIHWC